MKVVLPAGTKAAAAWDLVTRRTIAVAVDGSVATLPVADNPVALEILKE